LCGPGQAFSSLIPQASFSKRDFGTNIGPGGVCSAPTLFAIPSQARAHLAIHQAIPFGVFRALSPNSFGVQARFAGNFYSAQSHWRQNTCALCNILRPYTGKTHVEFGFQPPRKKRSGDKYSWGPCRRVLDRCELQLAGGTQDMLHLTGPKAGACPHQGGGTSPVTDRERRTFFTWGSIPHFPPRMYHGGTARAIAPSLLEAGQVDGRFCRSSVNLAAAFYFCSGGARKNWAARHFTVVDRIQPWRSIIQIWGHPAALQAWWRILGRGVAMGKISKPK